MAYQTKNRRYLNFGKKPYINPFFREKKRRSSRRPGAYFSWRIKLFAIGVFVLLAAAFWAVLFSGFFRVREIEITISNQNQPSAPAELRINPDALGDYIRSELSHYRWLAIPQNNIILADTDLLAKKIADKFAVDDVIVRKSYRGLAVSLSDRQYAFIWRENQVNYYIGANGAIIAPVNEETGIYEYPILENIGAKEISGNIIGYAERLPGLALLYGGLKAELPELAIDRALIDDDDKNYRIKLVKGPDLLFTQDENDIGFAKQIKKLKTIIREKLKESYVNYEYIDIRFGDRVFYK